MNVDIKIVKPPIEPRLPQPVDFDRTDAEEWARYAIKLNSWRTFVEIGEHNLVVTRADAIGCTPAVRTDVETAVAIAAPNGRVAVWYGRTSIARPTRTKGKSYRRRGATSYEAARAALGCKAAAALWDDRITRGGDRDVSALAMAACRILHADAFGETPTLRDRLLAEFATLCGADRPATTTLLRASEDALLAASALIAVKDYRGACQLLMGRGVSA
jgi:hypothetical protein